MRDANWPKECPPADANDLPSVAYRMLRTNVPLENDFLSWFEEGRQLPLGKDCEYRGLSLFTDLRDARHHIELFRHKSDPKPFVAEAYLESSHGNAKKSSTSRFPNHLTWWPDEVLEKERIVALFKLSD